MQKMYQRYNNNSNSSGSNAITIPYGPKKFFNSNSSSSQSPPEDEPPPPPPAQPPPVSLSPPPGFYCGSSGGTVRYPNKRESRIRCGNCREMGHVYRKCTKPITSFGIIAFKYDESSKEYKILLVQRKDTMGFVELIRGKYHALDEEAKHRQILILMSEITHAEREAIKRLTFSELWDKLWLNHESNCYKNEYIGSSNKYKSIDVQWYINNTVSKYNDTEWGIPKGRLNFNETPEHCAVREFCEETGYNQNDIRILTENAPLEEEFTGTNNKQYKHIYYLAISKSDIREPRIDASNISQAGEIKNVGWFSKSEALQSIREYDVEKKKIIEAGFKAISEGLHF
jgi:ADP-ribose pyrophosphatase YjhB (NUDIX family)